MVRGMRYEYLGVDQQAVAWKYMWIMQDGDWSRGWHAHEQNTLSHTVFMLFYPFSHRKKYQSHYHEMLSIRRSGNSCQFALYKRNVFHRFHGISEANKEERKKCVWPSTTLTILFSALELILLVQSWLWYDIVVHMACSTQFFVNLNGNYNNSNWCWTHLDQECLFIPSLDVRLMHKIGQEYIFSYLV